MGKDQQKSSLKAVPGGIDGIDKNLALTLLKYMHLGRKFEESVQYYFSLGKIHGTTHLGIGEEATGVGTCLALETQDRIYPTHRGHCSALSKGISIKGMMAEIFAKETGVCKGRGGSMHIADMSSGIMGSNGIVGPSLAIACGSAFAIKRRSGKNQVTVVFFGDGALNEGIVHEAMNLASVWNLPMIFVCVNNQYGMSTHISKVMKVTDLSKRAIPYDMQVLEVDGNDVLAVYKNIREARRYVLENSGPVMVIENTYRTSGHSKSDGNLYRTKEEINEWRDKAPIPKLCKTLLDKGICTQAELDAVEAEAKETIDEAIQFALDSPYPKIEDIKNDLYADL